MDFAKHVVESQMEAVFEQGMRNCAQSDDNQRKSSGAPPDKDKPNEDDESKVSLIC